MDFIFKSKKGKRDKNEDYYGHYKKELFIVADGLGGHPAGEVASKLAVEHSIDVYGKNIEKDPETLLEEIFSSTSKEIFEGSKRDPAKSGMGTTMNAVALDKEMIFSANVGDSRTYISTKNEPYDGQLVLISKDDRNAVNMLTGSLGTYPGRVEPHIKTVRRVGEEVVLLCTDGLTDFVDDAQIRKILLSGSNTKYLGKRLVNTAMEAGSSDNVTVCILKLT